ncbi:MAG TPA: hypothetical protein VGV60_05075 [Candidatus Polarisedimenticolia bacterium]|jgi:hypothetical protein|nr:hypothetical protein [Candidatus Polarisedimenticolia bacterium]
MLLISTLSIAVAAAPRAGAEEPRHPAIYVDKGACPGEGCTYGTWKVLKDTELHALPGKASKVVAKCRPGSEVLASTGEVHTVAGEFTVKKKYGAFVPGDTLWVYTYLGEGTFKVWFGGRFTEQDLGFSPWGGSGGSRCEVERFCWGELKRTLEMEWWIQIQNSDGVTGWTREAGSFDPEEKCAGIAPAHSWRRAARGSTRVARRAGR